MIKTNNRLLIVKSKSTSIDVLGTQFNDNPNPETEQIQSCFAYIVDQFFRWMQVLTRKVLYSFYLVLLRLVVVNGSALLLALVGAASGSNYTADFAIRINCLNFGGMKI